MPTFRYTQLHTHMYAGTCNFQFVMNKARKETLNKREWAGLISLAECVHDSAILK